MADGVGELGGDPLRFAVRECEEHDVEPGDVGRVEALVGDLGVGAGEGREQIDDRGPRVGLRGDKADLELGVAGEQAQELGARVPASPHDRGSIRHAA